MKNWIKEHESTITTISVAIGLWFAITQSFGKEFDRIDNMLTRLEDKVNDIDKRVFSMETIMIMQGAPIKSLSIEKEKNDPNRAS